jgi:hypothetical protein
MRLKALYSFILCCALGSIQAQTSVVNIDTLLKGTWKGSSICQIKESPCHDETVVYHISKNGGADSFLIKANKIVNGVEEEMGILPFVYNKTTHQLSSTAYGSWTFNIEPGKLEGTLLVRGQLYRKIQVFKIFKP